MGEFAIHADTGEPMPADLLARLLAAGLTVINDALLMMRERRIHVQCQFNLRQKSYRTTRLWGFAPGLNVNDQRYRPRILKDNSRF